MSENDMINLVKIVQDHERRITDLELENYKLKSDIIEFRSRASIAILILTFILVFIGCFTSKSFLIGAVVCFIVALIYFGFIMKIE